MGRELQQGEGHMADVNLISLVNQTKTKSQLLLLYVHFNTSFSASTASTPTLNRMASLWLVLPELESH